MNILIADDSALMRGIIREVLKKESDLTIVGEATNGEKAVGKSRELKPDLIIMDVNMPVMDGIEATKIIMEENPVPVLVFTSEVDVEKAFEAIESGAVEILKKPPIDQLNDPVFSKLFIDKIRALAKNRPLSKAAKVEPVKIEEKSKRIFSLIAIGASTGGPVAVREVLKALPQNYPIPIALVQHLEEGFDGGYVDWLDEASKVNVLLASEQGSFSSNTVIVAPADYHLRCTREGYILNQKEKVRNQRPAVDVLFSSAAEIYGQKVLGVLLTGMGRDGADGCVAIKANGGFTLCQDEATSAIYGMPKAAIELKGASKVLSLGAIAQFLVDLSNYHGK